MEMGQAESLISWSGYRDLVINRNKSRVRNEEKKLSNKIKLAEKIIAYIIVIIIIFTSGVFVGKKTATAAQTDMM